MFDHGRRITTLESTTDELHTQLTSVRSQTESIEQRLGDIAGDPQQRLAVAVHGVAEQLSGQLQQTLAELEAMRRTIDEMKRLREQFDASVRGEAEHAARVFAQIGRTYRADWTGYVSIYFDGGQTDVVELLVGDTSPPSTLVCTLNTVNDFNSYAGAVVRRGEYWMAKSSRSDGSSGVRIVFTPFA